jgi:hypothetical protein
MALQAIPPPAAYKRTAECDAADTSAYPLRDVFAKFWAPVPWLLKVSIAPDQSMLTGESLPVENSTRAPGRLAASRNAAILESLLALAGIGMAIYLLILR